MRDKTEMERKLRFSWLQSWRPADKILQIELDYLFLRSNMILAEDSWVVNRLCFVLFCLLFADLVIGHVDKELRYLAHEFPTIKPIRSSTVLISASFLRCTSKGFSCSVSSSHSDLTLLSAYSDAAACCAWLAWSSLRWFDPDQVAVLPAGGLLNNDSLFSSSSSTSSLFACCLRSASTDSWQTSPISEPAFLIPLFINKFFRVFNGRCHSLCSCLT